MASIAYVHTMAQYNSWMNERLFKLCETLSDSERKLDRGAFFKSIHGTLGHIHSWRSDLAGPFSGMPISVRVA